MVRYAAAPTNPAKGKFYYRCYHQETNFETHDIHFTFVAAKSRGSYLRVHVCVLTTDSSKV